jgi:ankyrin repeat protein
MDTILEMEPNIDAHDGKDGSALHIGIRSATEEAVWRILAKKPYINAVSEDGSPLAAAIDVGMIPIAHELIRLGADLNIKGNRGGLLDIACMRGNIEMAKILLEKGVDINSGRGTA